MTKIYHVMGAGVMLLLLLANTKAPAQTITPPREFNFTPERPGSSREERRQRELSPSPVTPMLELPPPPPPSSDQLSQQLRIYVKKIKLTGNTVYSNRDLHEIISPYENRTLSSDDLQNLRQALTVHYVNHGYINSGAILPDQEVKDGVVEYRIIEGRLNDVEITGNKWLRKSYAENRIRIHNGKILNLKQLQDSLQILRQDLLIDRINAELRPGTKPGESQLQVDIGEARPYEVWVNFNNRRSPSVGELRGEIFATHHNVTGFGDSVYGRFGTTEGLDDFGFGYSVPLSAYDTRFRIYFDRSNSRVVEEPFDRSPRTGIKSQVESYGLGISHPFYRTPQQQLTGEIILEHRWSDTQLGGDSFPFYLQQYLPIQQSLVDANRNIIDGKTEMTVLRLVQEWLDRDLDHVLAIRSSFNLGVDILGSTNRQAFLDTFNGETVRPKNVPTGQFFSWLGQFQWVQRLGTSDNQVLFRSDLQLTPYPLLPLEKFALGGAGSVRGYRENFLVRDNGWVNSIEFRLPIYRIPLPWISSTPQDGQLQLAPFFDMGWSFNTGIRTPQPDLIYSIGLGLRWDPHRNIHSELYWGHALKRDRETLNGTSLQDDGIHFALAIRLL